MRLAPIERPRGVLMRMAYRISRSRFGKVISPLKVIYARKPSLLALSLHMQRVLEHGLSLPPGLRLLVQAQVARLNGCTFCHDLALAEAFRLRLGGERFAALAEWRAGELFTERERGVLAFAEEMSVEHAASDATFAALRTWMSEEQLVELAWLVAMETYFNRMAAALGVESDGLAASLAAARPREPAGAPERAA